MSSRLYSGVSVSHEETRWAAVIRLWVFMLAGILFAFLILYPDFPRAGREQRLSDEDQLDASNLVHLLADLKRENVEEVVIDKRDMIAVTIVKNVSGNVSYKARAALVPFQLNGVDGGNIQRYYVALVKFVDSSKVPLISSGILPKPNRRVALLDVAQFDNRWRLLPEWSEATVDSTGIHLIVEILDCDRYKTTATITVNDNDVGDKININMGKGSNNFQGCVSK